MAGLNQLGLSETIAEVISKMPEELRGMYWANIGILGGLGYVEALGERLSVFDQITWSVLTSREQDLRALCPCDYEIGIFEAFE
jgi:actin-related protein 6